ncbi:MAG: RidA family protein [Thermoguttaceae bacterium]|nr:RidA family protein [Thermoguttaceae bacterium]MDW8079208.1 RidA family protein [Thermoguttaceae bacterium]
MDWDPDQRFNQLLESRGWSSLSPPAPKGLYRPVLRIDSFIYTSGHLPIGPDGAVVCGQVGRDVDEAQAAQAAALAMASILRALQQELGSLSKVARVVRLFGLVNAVADFTAHPRVLNGASEVLAEVFGSELGVGVRTAAGASSLPLGAVVELEAIFRLKSESLADAS